MQQIIARHAPRHLKSRQLFAGPARALRLRSTEDERMVVKAMVGLSGERYRIADPAIRARSRRTEMKKDTAMFRDDAAQR